MKINAAYLALAVKLQEAATAMSHDDIQQRLRDALNDKYRGTGTWAYLITVFGDDQSGFCVYSCDSDLLKADYTCSTTGATIATDTAVSVVPLTTYEVESTTVAEAGRRNSTRDLKQLQTIHDASMNLGAVCKTSEAHAHPPVAGKLKLIESAATVETIVLRESRADYEIKLIAPGKGSSAFYPAEVLKRDGPKVFTSGTHVYLNHPTVTQEAERPEGDVANLAGVLTTTAQYHESHAKGPGLYARMKVFADHAQMVEEKAAHVGMSIRAYGNKESDKQQDGLPVLKELLAAESVDVVTRAGAGGMILTESAAPAAKQQEGALTLEESQKLVNAAVAAATAPLLARALREDAREEAGKVLATVALSEKAKGYVIGRCLTDLPLKEGALDPDKFRERVVTEAQAYASTIEGGQVRGMGAAPVQLTEADIERQAKLEERQEAANKRLRESTVNVFGRLVGGDKKVAEAMASKGMAA